MTELKTVVSSLEKLELTNKPTLIITDRVMKQIDYLHKKVGNNEWSGELITREEGTINDLDGWKVICEDIFLADIGTGAFTGYEVDKGGFKTVDIVEMYEQFPGLLDGSLKNHHLHSHHSMGVFFSGTDWSQLNDRSLISNYFIMLIVNIAGGAIAKVGFKANISNGENTKISFANDEEKTLKPLELKEKNKKEKLVVMDFKVEKEASIQIANLSLSSFTTTKLMEISSVPSTKEEIKQAISMLEAEINKEDVDEIFQRRYEAVKKAIEEDKKSIVNYSGESPDFGKRGKWDWKNGKWEQKELWEQPRDAFDEYKPFKKSKSISEMTEEEFQEFMKEEEPPKQKWEIRHARVYLNYLLSDYYDPANYKNPMEQIEQIEKEMDLVSREAYLQEMEFGMGEKFDSLFPYNDTKEYVKLLNVTKEFLLPYAKNSMLVKELIEMMESEAELNGEEEIKMIIHE